MKPTTETPATIAAYLHLQANFPELGLTPSEARAIGEISAVLADWEDRSKGCHPSKQGETRRALLSRIQTAKTVDEMETARADLAKFDGSADEVWSLSRRARKGQLAKAAMILIPALKRERSKLEAFIGLVAEVDLSDFELSSNAFFQRCKHALERVDNDIKRAEDTIGMDYKAASSLLGMGLSLRDRADSFRVVSETSDTLAVSPMAPAPSPSPADALAEDSFGGLAGPDDKG